MKARTRIKRRIDYIKLLDDETMILKETQNWLWNLTAFHMEKQSSAGQIHTITPKFLRCSSPSPLTLHQNELFPFNIFLSFQLCCCWCYTFLPNCIDLLAKSSRPIVLLGLAWKISCIPSLTFFPSSSSIPSMIDSVIMWLLQSCLHG